MGKRQKPKKPEYKDTCESGVLTVTSRRNAYVSCGDKEIRVDPEDLLTAFTGDIVSVDFKKKGDQHEGKVIAVLERKRTKFVGVAENENGQWFMAPDNKRVRTDFHLTENTRGLSGDEKIYIELIEWENADEKPKARVLEILGMKGEHEAEMRAVVLDRGFVIDFPPEVENAASVIKENKQEILNEQEASRRDFRGITTFTIDPHDAKDFDDAISIEKLENGNTEVGIHIADVSAYVQVNDAIDKEAQERGTSIYLVDRTIPMLPEVLSNDVCSLNPNEDKLTFSAVFELDQNGEVKNRWFGRTIINSDRRFTYQEAQEMIDGAQGEFAEEILIANDLSSCLLYTSPSPRD